MNIAIVDDVEQDRQVLAALLENLLNKNDFSCTIKTFERAEAFLKVFEKDAFDLCFMDIFMDGMNGMDAAKYIATADPDCMLIFLSTSPDYMAEGYIVRAWRYLLKPISKEALCRILPQCIERAVLDRRRLEVRINGKIREIPYSKILYLIRVNRHIEIHLTDQIVTLPSTQSFTKTTEALLEDYRFILSCKGVVVNMIHVVQLSGSDFIMDNGEKAPISQRRLSTVTNDYMDFKFEYL